MEDVDPWAKSIGDADAVLVLDLTSSKGPVLQAIGKVDIPKLLFTRPITGWAFMDGPEWIQKGLKGDMVASSNFEDLVPFVVGDGSRPSFRRFPAEGQTR